MAHVFAGCAGHAARNARAHVFARWDPLAADSARGVDRDRARSTSARGVHAARHGRGGSGLHRRRRARRSDDRRRRQGGARRRRPDPAGRPARRHRPRDGARPPPQGERPTARAREVLEAGGEAAERARGGRRGAARAGRRPRRVGARRHRHDRGPVGRLHDREVGGHLRPVSRAALELGQPVGLVARGGGRTACRSSSSPRRDSSARSSRSAGLACSGGQPLGGYASQRDESVAMSRRSRVPHSPGAFTCGSTGTRTSRPSRSRS